jgi:hypothetical protein
MMSCIKSHLLPLILSALLLSCSRIEVIHETVETGLAADVTALQVSDLHLRAGRKIYSDLIRIINESRPDILLLNGDLFDTLDKMPLLDEFLSKLDPGILKFAVSGNWEYWCGADIREVRAIYEKYGIRFLINQGESVTIREQPFYIYGTDDFTGGHPSLENFKRMPETQTLIMTHSPVFFDTIKKLYPDERIDVFSGHTHGGQITFFGHPLYLPPCSGNYARGVYRFNRLTLFVTKGIGNSTVDIRIGAKPDVISILFKKRAH